MLLYRRLKENSSTFTLPGTYISNDHYIIFTGAPKFTEWKNFHDSTGQIQNNLLLFIPTYSFSVQVDYS